MRVSRLLVRLLLLALIVAGGPYLWLRYQQSQRDRALDTALKRGDLLLTERLVLRGVTLAGHPQRARAILVLVADRLVGPAFLSAYLRDGGRLPSLDDREWLRRPGEAEWTDWPNIDPEAMLRNKPLAQSFGALIKSLEAVPVTQRTADFYHLLGDCRYEGSDYAGAAAAFRKAWALCPGDGGLQNSLEVSQDAARVKAQIIPQLERELRQHVRRHPGELRSNAEDGDRPKERPAPPRLVVFGVRRVSRDRVVVLSGGTMAAGDFRQDVTHVLNLRLSLWNQAGGKPCRLWTSPAFTEMADPNDLENPRKAVDLRTLDLDADGRLEVIATLVRASRYIGTNYRTDVTTYVFANGKRRLRKVAKLDGASKNYDSEWPWVADLRGDGRYEIGNSYGVGLWEDVVWTDIYAWRNGRCESVNREYPERFRGISAALNQKITEYPTDDGSYLYRGQAEEILGQPAASLRSYQQAARILTEDVAGEKDPEMRSYSLGLLKRVKARLAALCKAHPELPPAADGKLVATKLTRN